MSDTAQGMRREAPDLSRYFERGAFVAVSARIGNDVTGYVCDRDGNGLLLDVRDASGDPSGYEYLPWSSIERVVLEG